MAKLTDKIIFTGTTSSMDLIHIVDVDDTTDGPAGTSYAIRIGTILQAVNQSVSNSLVWTGGTGINSAMLKSGGNQNSGSNSVVSGTINNTNGVNSVVMGGTENVITGGTENSIIMGGNENTINNGNTSTIISGFHNTISGSIDGSVIIGGQYSTADKKSAVFIGLDSFNEGVEYTTHVNKLMIVNCQEFATQSEAISFGLTKGMVYRTGEDLKIVI